MPMQGRLAVVASAVIFILSLPEMPPMILLLQRMESVLVPLASSIPEKIKELPVVAVLVDVMSIPEILLPVISVRDGKAAGVNPTWLILMPLKAGAVVVLPNTE